MPWDWAGPVPSPEARGARHRAAHEDRPRRLVRECLPASRQLRRRILNVFGLRLVAGVPEYWQWDRVFEELRSGFLGRAAAPSTSLVGKYIESQRLVDKHLLSVPSASLVAPVRPLVEQQPTQLFELAHLLGRSKAPGKPSVERILELRCDKAIQCSDAFEVSPDVRFFSRSSVFIDLQKAAGDPRHRRRRGLLDPTPSLEYVARYLPEGGNSGLRSFSSSAIFKLNKDAGRQRLNCGDCSAALPIRKPNLTCRVRPRRRGRDSALADVVARRIDRELRRYTNFIESDLATRFHGTGRAAHKICRQDIRTVKKILLEDYITEIREIVRDDSRKCECRCENRIIADLKARMDEDLLNWTSEPSSSQTRSETTSMPCTHESTDSLKRVISYTNSNYPVNKSTKRPRLASRAGGASSRQPQQASIPMANSSHSVDSGVLVDFGRGADDGSWQAEPPPRPGSCSEDRASQRVDSAIRKFTEDLILCERRVRCRARGPGCCARCCQGTARCSSEEEDTEEIPSLSLSSFTDSDYPSDKVA